MAPESQSSVDLRLRIIILSLEPTLALARIMGLPLDDLQQLVADGYFREVRKRGLSLRQISRRLGKSVRTVATLSKRAQETGAGLEGSRRLSWQREVVRTTAPKGLSAEEIGRSISGVKKAHLEEELSQMVEAGLLRTDERGLYWPATEHFLLAREDVDARLESLRHFLETVAHVVYRRFFRPLPGAEAFARVLTFSVRPEALTELRERHYAALRQEVLEVDAASPEAPQGSVLFAAVTSPTDLAWRRRSG